MKLAVDIRHSDEAQVFDEETQEVLARVTFEGWFARNARLSDAQRRAIAEAAAKSIVLTYQSITGGE